MAGAPYNNKNAEKWTLEDAIAYFDLLESKAKETITYKSQGFDIVGYNCHYLGEVADEAETTIDVMKYVRDKYNLKSRYFAIKRKCERNCFTDTKKGLINTAMGIINLKSNHGWTDRVDTTTKGKEITTITRTIVDGTDHTNS